MTPSLLPIFRADRPVASAGRTSMRGAGIRMRQTTLGGVRLGNAKQRVETGAVNRLLRPSAPRALRDCCLPKRATLISNPPEIGRMSAYF
jgi:hypothetical protein